MRNVSLLLLIVVCFVVWGNSLSIAASSGLGHKEKVETDREGLVAREAPSFPWDRGHTEGKGVKEPSVGYLFVKSLGAFLFVFGVILVVFYLWKKYFFVRGSATGGEKAIKVLAIHHFSPKQALVLVDVGGHLLLLGLTSSSISMLCHLKPPEVAGFERVLGEEEEQVKVALSGVVESIKQKLDLLRGS